MWLPSQIERSMRLVQSDHFAPTMSAADAIAGARYWPSVLVDDRAPDLVSSGGGPASPTDTCLRDTTDYTPLYQRFVVKDKCFSQQFSHIYLRRLQEMRTIVSVAAEKKWKGVPLRVASKVNELCEGEMEWVVIGTIYKQMKLKPCILDEYSEDATVAVIPESKSNYCSPDDTLELEDGSGRVVLVIEGCMPVHQLITGVVVAVRGRATPDGGLRVTDWCCAGDADQLVAVGSEAEAEAVARPLGAAGGEAAEGAGGYVLFVSGLLLGGSGPDAAAAAVATQLLVDYVCGQLGGRTDVGLCGRVVRVVIAGDSIAPTDGSGGKASAHAAAAPLHALDLLLAQLCRAVPVDVLPGCTEPSNQMVPQQPLHRSLLPLASRFSSMRCVTNPYHCRVGGVSLLGSSGQPLSDLARFTQEGEETEAEPCSLLARTLAWRHMAPTAPDTLACYPHHDEDPFVIRDCPQVYFAGNQPVAGSRVVTVSDPASSDAAAGAAVRLLSLPSFASSRTATLLCLKTLQTHEITFGGKLGAV